MPTLFETIDDAFDVVKENIDPFSFTVKTKLPSGAVTDCIRLSSHPSDVEARRLQQMGLREATPIYTPNNGMNGRDWYLPS